MMMSMTTMMMTTMTSTAGWQSVIVPHSSSDSQPKNVKESGFAVLTRHVDETYSHQHQQHDKHMCWTHPCMVGRAEQGALQWGPGQVGSNVEHYYEAQAQELVVSSGQATSAFWQHHHLQLQ
jgi:hypothetical protein